MKILKIFTRSVIFAGHFFLSRFLLSNKFLLDNIFNFMKDFKNIYVHQFVFTSNKFIGQNLKMLFRLTNIFQYKFYSY